ncbi:hypothetical protein [Bordetella holmesii]|nr:hypothetical protein FYB59_11970 [Bordetella holmesii]QGB15428.1 hypothetical protein FYB57_11970 [Bordetella holmesii]QGB64674.1 hypothetical protein FYB43_11970 [Bordetella holmesii]QGC43224.1 hypothetical protein FYB19_11980 [Bordetella holmesii]QGC63133.1 hypothetical protein FYB13_11970 [Bordetella holmesii]
MTERSMGVTRACGLVGISRSLFAYESTRSGDAALTERMKEMAVAKRRYGYRRIHVSADVILTHRVGVNLTHLGDDGGLLAADNVDSGASSGDQGNGASRRQHSGDGQAAGLLTQHDQAVSA